MRKSLTRLQKLAPGKQNTVPFLYTPNIIAIFVFFQSIFNIFERRIDILVQCFNTRFILRHTTIFEREKIGYFTLL